MRAEYSKHIHHTTNEVQSGGVGVRPHFELWTRWANAGPATYVHLGKAGPGLSHNRLWPYSFIYGTLTGGCTQVQTFFVFFLYAAAGNDFFAVFQYTAYWPDCTSYQCGSKLARRPWVFPGMLRTSYMSTSCKIEKLFQSSLHFKNA